MKKDYTYEEFQQMPELVKYWAKKISEEDGRPAHPEDYVGYANLLINKAVSTNDLEDRLFEMVVALDKHTPCHRDWCYSFLDWFDYVVGR